MRLVRFATAPYAAVAFFLTLSTVAGCRPRTQQHDASTVRVTGSDTMVTVANAWSEEFRKSHPDIAVPIKGGGSGVGIAKLCQGAIDIATSSREMAANEIELAKKNTGKEPKEFIVGRDALAIYVHPDNPLETISIPELRDLYGEGSLIDVWQQLAIDNMSCAGGKIILIGRQNSSGTYAYFQEVVLGKGSDGKQRNFRQGITGQSGSSDVVTLVSHTPCAIGYSGMGYKTPSVKFVKVSKDKGEPGIEPTLETALNGTYPISRPLYLYTLGEPTGAVLEFIQWVQGDEGQKIVEQEGYVPLPKPGSAAGPGGSDSAEPQPGITE